MLVYSMTNLMQMLPFPLLKRCSVAIQYIGKHTLHIFLYHQIFIDLLVKFFHVEFYPIKLLVYISLSLFGPLLIKYVLNYTKTIFKSVL